ncbi:hypothetical protein FACS189473_2660 [Spirochaetia bacterium]|nr:hypothetical protein FACS189473_2660 [Spirochaetia bacterium]
MVHFLFWCIARVYALFHPGQCKASRPVEGNSIDFQKGEALWWGYKFFCRQIEEPEPGKGIEEHFASQTMDFTPPAEFVPSETLCLTVGGDLMPSAFIYPHTAAHFWDDIADFYLASDIAYANLESPIAAGKPLSYPTENVVKPPAMNNTREAFDLYWKDGKGVNFFSTANNHALDMGVDGLIETLDFLDTKHAPHVGTSRNAAERDDIPVIEKKGVRIAFLSYTFSLNRQVMPEGQEFLANYVRVNRPDCDISLIKRHINIARKEKKADLVVACMHWSLEFESFPIQNVIDRGHQLLEAGIDVILGNHSHTLQSAEQYVFTDQATGLKKKGLILYAMGDMASGCPGVPNSSLSAVARIGIQKGTVNGQSVTLVNKVAFKPLYRYTVFQDKRCTDYRLLDIERLAEEITGDACTLPLSKKQKKEALRLRALAERVMPFAFRKN